MTRFTRTRAALLVAALFGLLLALALPAPLASAQIALEDPPIISLDLVQPPNASLKAITISENPYWGTAYPPKYYTYGVTSNPAATAPDGQTFDTADGHTTLDLTGYDPKVDWYVMANLTTDRSGSNYTTGWSALLIVAGPDATASQLPDPTPPPVPDPAPTPAPKLHWVALGDSFSSGEGVEPFIDGTNVTDDQCHRSTQSYAEDIVAANPSTYSLEFRACSGAVFSDLYHASKLNPLETTPQLDWVQPDADIVTLTIGGNDAHFAEVMRYCATRFQFLKTCERVWSSVVDKAIRRLEYQYANAVYWIKQKAPNARVYLLGYPRFFPVNPPKNCPTGVPGYVFGQKDMLWINTEIKKVDESAELGAKLAGATYVDTYDMTGDSHDICSSEPWISRAIPFPRIHRVYSFHPNPIGQMQLALKLYSAMS